MQSIHLESSSAEAHCSSEPAVLECYIADHYHLPNSNCCIFQPLIQSYSSIDLFKDIRMEYKMGSFILRLKFDFDVVELMK